MICDLKIHFPVFTIAKIHLNLSKMYRSTWQHQLRLNVSWAIKWWAESIPSDPFILYMQIPIERRKKNKINETVLNWNTIETHSFHIICPRLDNLDNSNYAISNCFSTSLLHFGGRPATTVPQSSWCVGKTVCSFPHLYSVSDRQFRPRIRNSLKAHTHLHLGQEQWARTPTNGKYKIKEWIKKERKKNSRIKRSGIMRC